MGINIHQAPRVAAAPPAEPQKPCPHCDGFGQVPSANGMRRCQCAIFKTIRAKLGDLVHCGRLTLPQGKSPLCTGRPGDPDMTQEDLFISGSWDWVGRHLRAALAVRYFRALDTFSHVVLTDEDIKSSFFGELGGDDDVRADRVRDMVSASYHLVIIRTGFACVPNKALPGLVLEALRHREQKRVPTWVIEETEMPLRSSPAWSPQLGQYLDRRYRRVEITPEDEGADHEGEAP